MLETEEVDDDYFTPVAKTSLATIFKKPVADEKSENETLKYNAPILKSTQNEEDLQIKTVYKSIFSCVFDAYLWLDNVYTHRGKLGCAVVKLTTDGSLNIHNILLYDSKKATVSSATVTKELEVTVKGKDFISYYDRYKKYWCLYGSEDDIKKVIDILKTCNANIKELKESDETLPEQKHPETTDAKINVDKINVESDTDSSINRKTKASILNRMANMGQSVLPPRAISIEQTSDSSDMNESDIIPIRHKPIKSIVKKNNLDKNTEAFKKSVVPLNQHPIENNTCMVISDQLIPSQGTSNIANTSGNDLNYFFAEQRITNSELRINITRLSDKVDSILNKVNNLDIKDKHEESTNINTEILQKLLKEYESKIKTYENLIKNKGKETNGSQNCPSVNELFGSQNELMFKNELTTSKNKITELDECIKQKDMRISILNDEIKMLRESNNLLNAGELQEKLCKYEQALFQHQEALKKLTEEKNELVRSHNDQIEQKIKGIMNDTFRAIEINFDNNESYLGSTIKNMIATVIKKVTLESLNKSK